MVRIDSKTAKRIRKAKAKRRAVQGAAYLEHVEELRAVNKRRGVLGMAVVEQNGQPAA